MSLLAQEFGKTITSVAFKELLSERQNSKKPAIQIDDNLRNRLKDFTYSFSSLLKILECPFCSTINTYTGVNPFIYG